MERNLQCPLATGLGIMLESRIPGVYTRISTSHGKQTTSMDNQLSKLVDNVNHQLSLRLYGINVDIGRGRNAESRKELHRLLDDWKKSDSCRIAEGTDKW